jgi:uncharacterized protein (TIGR02246 family)
MTANPLLAELNRDIWRPFVRTYHDRDLEAFLSLYDRDLIRAGGPAKEVYGYERYAAGTADWFAQVAERGDSLAIEFRFTERIADGDLASERGVFRITATRPGADQLIFHSQFHTLARKTDGRWRIVADYDTNENGAITAESFAAATPIEAEELSRPA